MLRFSCAKCKTVLQAQDGQAGAKITCPACKAQMLVPAPVTEAAAVAGPAPQANGSATGPAPDEWYYTRDGQRAGPVTTAQLRQLADSGQLQPADRIWRPGMADWAAAGTVAEAFPGFDRAGAAAQAGRFWQRVSFHPRRAFASDLQTLPVTDRERARLAAHAITEEAVQRYLAWRHSILLVILGPIILSALLGSIKMFGQFEGLTGFGALANVIHILSLYAMPLAVLAACLLWSHLKLSRTLLLYGWVISFLVPIMVALFPLDWLVNMDAAIRADNAEQHKLAVGIASALTGLIYFFMFLPVVLSLMPGCVRACLRIKTLLPESIVPGWFLVAASVVYAFIILPVFIAVSKFTGNLMLIVGVLLVVCGPLVYVFFARVFIRPLSSDEDVRQIRRVQKIAGIVTASSLVLLVIFAMTKKVPLGEKYLVGFSSDSSLLQPWSWGVIHFAIEYVGRSLYVTAVAADLFMMLNISVWVNGKKFAATARAEAYDRLIGELDRVIGAGEPMPSLKELGQGAQRAMQGPPRV